MVVFEVDPQEDFRQVWMTCLGRELGRHPVIALAGRKLFRARGDQQLADLRLAKSGGQMERPKIRSVAVIMKVLALSDRSTAVSSCARTMVSSGSTFSLEGGLRERTVI